MTAVAATNRAAVDIENERGSVESHLAYIAHPREGKARLFKGNGIIHFEYENDDWSVSGFQLPGFG